MSEQPDAPPPADRPPFEVLHRPGAVREDSPLSEVLRQGARWLLVLGGVFFAPLLLDAVMTPLTRALRQREGAEATALREAARRGEPGAVIAWGDRLLDDGRPERAAEEFLRALRAGDPAGAERMARLAERAGRPVLAEAWRRRAARPR